MQNSFASSLVAAGVVGFTQVPGADGALYVGSHRVPQFDDPHEVTPRSQWVDFTNQVDLTIDAIVRQLSWSQIWEEMLPEESLQARFTGVEGAFLWQLTDLLHVRQKKKLKFLWDREGTERSDLMDLVATPN